MFIEITRRLSQAPEERHMADVAPPELGELLGAVFYKHYAPAGAPESGNSPAVSVLAAFS
jgi:hypothetical protein